MTFVSRMRNSFAKFVASDYPREPGYVSSRERSMPALNVNAVKMSITEAAYFSQPVWGPDLTGAGAHSREGYTSRPFDKPAIPFSIQASALQTDEDVQLAINHLSSQISGGAHFWSTMNEGLTDYMTRFTKDFNFDTFDSILLKEALWYGNSIWKPRMGIENVRRFDDLMHIPISSFVRIWWDRQRIPYKYEFRGSEYQGYHNPGEIIHFWWNPVNASVFGTGFGIAMLAARDFEQITPTGPIDQRLPSLLDRKYSTQHTMQITERRYIPHNIYVAKNADTEERRALQNDVADLKPGEDFTVGTEVEVQELGSTQRAFNPVQFSDLTMGAIMKAMNDFRGKMGQESSHQFANAKQSAVLDEIGLASFPLHIITQLLEKFFKPWYEANPYYDPMYAGGIIPIPFDEGQIELNFGQVEKKDVPIEHQIKLIELAIQTGAVQDPAEIRKLFDDAGLGLTQEFTDAINMMNQMQDPMMGMGQEMPVFPPVNDIGGGTVQDPTNWFNQVMGSPPMSTPIYDQISQDLRGTGFAELPFDPQPSNKSQDWNFGRNYERR